MDSPLARVILALLGGYLIILFFLSVYDWMIAEYPQRPTKPPSLERIQQSFYHEEAVKALQQFSKLPKSESKKIHLSYPIPVHCIPISTNYFNC